MITITWPPDLLRLGDLTCLSLGELLDLAARMKADAGGWREALAGQPLACAEEREIVVRRAYTDEPEPTLTAIADMLQDAEDFHLFVHARAGQDVVVHWLGAGRIALLFPPRRALADEGDLVVAQPSWFSEPLPFATARREMDLLTERAVNTRVLYFVDAGDGRGKAIYLRLDGDCGLVEPAP